MKILCLLVFLANILLFLWEYRNGAFVNHNPSPGQHTIEGQVPILLLHELKLNTNSVPPNTTPTTDFDAVQASTDNKETSHNAEATDITKTNPTESLKTQPP